MRTRVHNVSGLMMGMLVLTILAAVHSPSAMGQAAPQWKVGDSWHVGAWHAQVFRPEEQAQRGTHKLRGRMISVAFEVTGEKALDQTPCYEVTVTFPQEETGFQRRFLLYYLKDARKLLRVRDVSRLPDGTAKDLTNDLPAESRGPVFTDDIPGAVPLEWPDLARENVPAQPAPAGTLSQVTVPDMAPDGEITPEDEVSLTRSTPTTQAKVVQRWRKGEPWWRVARKYDGNRLIGEAILLDVNGQQVATMPATSQ